MNIFIVTFGSRGDVQPYAALGKGLQIAGHSVMVCTAEDYEPFIREHGLEYGYMTGELLKLIDTDAGREAMEETVGLLGSLKSMIKLTRQTKPLNRQMVLDSWAAAQEMQPDLVLYHPKALAAVSIAEAFNAPPVMALLQPMMIPTAEFPPPGMPALPLGGAYNKLSYKAVAAGYSTYTGMVNELRQEKMGLKKFPRGTGLYQTADGKPITVLHGFSAHVIPRPGDWPEHVHIPGYWFLDRQEDWQPSAELADFLAAGEAPVYVGFGSMAGKDPARLTKIVVDALQQARVRGILASGWGGLKTADLPGSILQIEGAPHDWLFPQMAAVLHHGGAGTTAAGLRAGRPSVICPFMGDQPFWGSRVHALGVGPQPIPQKKLTANELAAAIRTAVSDERMQEKANSLGQKIRGEDGVRTAVAAIEQMLETT
jgi:sterol 3beta-glucosyltransferase